MDHIVVLQILFFKEADKILYPLDEVMSVGLCNPTAKELFHAL